MDKLPEMPTPAPLVGLKTARTNRSPAQVFEEVQRILFLILKTVGLPCGRRRRCPELLENCPCMQAPTLLIDDS